MDIIEESPIKYDDIFHYLTGKYTKRRGIFRFYLNNEEYPLDQTFYETTETVSIADPALDANFKSIFLNHAERLENFLNEIYFIPNNMKISHIKFLPGEFNQIGTIYNLITLRADIACKAKVCELDKNNDIKEEKTTLLDIEIQINWIEKLDDKLLEYGTLLRNSYSNQKRIEQYLQDKKEEGNKKNKHAQIGAKKNKRVYIDTLVIALILDKQSLNETNYIKLVREKIDTSTIPMNNIKILEINAFKVFQVLDNPFRPPKTFGNLSKEGKDWIKLITLRTWAEKDEDSIARYEIPKLKFGHKYSQNKHINDAIYELTLENRMQLTLMTQVQEYMERLKEEGIQLGKEEGIKLGKKEGIKLGKKEGIKIGKEEAEKETKLALAYLFFLTGLDLKQYNLKYTYKKKDIPLILKKEPNLNLDKKNIDNFILALDKIHAIRE